MSEASKFALKIVNNRLVIDLNKMTDDYMEAYGYDGKPSMYDIGELGCAEVVAEIELGNGTVKKIMAEYDGGGECGLCGDIARKLRPCHPFDLAGRICQRCWEHDRETYKGSYGEDIGPFETE
ncbi:hypothetical protein [Pseudobacillus badius]|uniref:hypothetical protein n=1 Tax=Bacillus badius TaxID=1455 RepID=UPI0024A1E5CA|nr:hypothetical protein [Bacillus badius]GLY11371.1 hypothetical protein Bbad01_25870 [Bacillus badius]